MKNLEPCKLGEIINFKRGYDLPDRLRISGDYPIVSSSGITDYHNEYKVKNHCVATGRYGTLGIIHFVDEPCWPLNTALYVTDFKGNAPKYIYYFLKTLRLEEFNGASAVPGLDRNVLHKIKCLVTKNFEKQKDIAAVLSAYDDLIEVNNQRIKVLDESARALYKEWFVRMRFPNYKYIKFEKGIPSGWTSERLVNHIKIIRGKSYTSEEIDDSKGEYPFINLKNIKRGGGFRLDGTKFYSGKFKKDQVVKPGDVVMAITDMTQERSIVGRVARVPLTEFKEYVISLDVTKIEAFTLPIDFIYSTLRYNYYGETLAEYANGANVLHLNPELLKKEFILIPNQKIVEAFVDNVKPIFELSDILEMQNGQLRLIRDRLLPRLISGKLEVRKDLRRGNTVLLQVNNTAIGIDIKEPKKTKNANLYFKRRVLAAHIIDNLKNENTFGHVKLMKLMYLSEQLAEIDTASNYHRDAAGPYDNQMIRSIDSQLKKAQWFESVKTDQRYSYKPLPKATEYQEWFDKYYGDKKESIATLLKLFGKEKTEKVEMVATLYEAYRDLRSKREVVNDDEVVNEVLNNWHDSKKRIAEDRWRICLKWMKEKGWAKQ